MVNTLVGKYGFKLGPVLFQTLLRHYFERPRQNADKLQTTVQLMHDELLYDEVFNIVKSFLDASTRHTVEELQGFSNARTPSPPWVHVVRLVVPMSCCDEGAKYLIKALGGEEVCLRIVGGTKWWQVRGIRGVDAEWITAKKDWQEAKKRYKFQQQKGHGKEKTEESAPSANEEPEAESGTYHPDMDEMRCILYSHGGGYYFGSVDQERYAIQRFARKINGRVFAVNYRLAPQYPFPCAIQDLLAAYLYLIRPPKDAAHRPVKPAHIVFAGDSAGGGLTLALLQAVRDSGLPLPSGAVLISPWCDLTHSFGSILTNTGTDVIPKWGLSMHKPSTLWPPPSDELTTTIHSRLRSRIRQLARLDSASPADLKPPASPRPTAPASATASPDTDSLPKDGERVNRGATAPLPTPFAAGPSTPGSTTSETPQQRISLTTATGEVLTIEQQIQLYAPNDLLVHPYISSALAYLGGLPPLLFIVSDKEVLRDEGIYTAHRAANPDKYPIRDEQRKIYPAFEGIEGRYGPTTVHLQVYDDAAHVLPILFSFTTPAKFCYRAIAAFCKHVTGLPQKPLEQPPGSPTGLGFPFAMPRHSLPAGAGAHTDGADPRSRPSRLSMARASTYIGLRSRPASSGGAGTMFDVQSPTAGEFGDAALGNADERLHPTSPSLRRSFSESITRAASVVRRRSRIDVQPPLVEETASQDGTPRTPNTLRSPKTSRTPSRIDDNAPLQGQMTEEPESERGSITAVLGQGLVVTPPGSPDQKAVNGNAKGVPDEKREQSTASEDVAGPRFKPEPSPPPTPGQRTAGDHLVYTAAEDELWENNMIRERVATSGVIRPLEPESDIAALNIPSEQVGVVSELAMRRYLEGRAKFDKKFKRQAARIQNQRRRNLERARKDTAKMIPHLQSWLYQDDGAEPHGAAEDGLAHEDGADVDASARKGKKRLKDGVFAATSGSWGWAWALDGAERPPPSSIAARRDTNEARRLARIADQHVGEDNAPMSGNKLWGLVMTFLTVAPDGKRKKHGHGVRTAKDAQAASVAPRVAESIQNGTLLQRRLKPQASAGSSKRKSTFSAIFRGERSEKIEEVEKAPK